MINSAVSKSDSLIVEPLVDEEEWERFVAGSPVGTFFHTLKWKGLLESSFPVVPMYTVIRDSKEGLIGVCPFVLWKELRIIKVLDSLPYSDYAGPLVKEGYAEPAMEALVTYLKRLARRQGITYAKIRFSNEYLSRCLSSDRTRVDTSMGTMVLDLQEKPADFIWNKNLNSKRRDQIRKLEQDGYQIRECVNIDDINIFYNLHCKSMDYIGASHFPYNLFYLAFNSFYPQNFNVLLMEKEKHCFAGLQFFIYEPRKIIYQTVLGIDRSVRYRGTPYHYLSWSLIKWAEKYGYRYVDFGATPFDPDDVHYQNKNYFGGDFNQDYFVYLPLNHKLFFMRESMKNIWRCLQARLPRSLAHRLSDLAERR